MTRPPAGPGRRPFFRLTLSLCLLALLAAGCGRPQQRVVLYCAQDQEFAEKLLGEFTAKTGLPVVPRYDTEANKSVSLYEELIREAVRSVCITAPAATQEDCR